MMIFLPDVEVDYHTLASAWARATHVQGDCLTGFDPWVGAGPVKQERVLPAAWC
jgi:hypothetical protein